MPQWATKYSTQPGRTASLRRNRVIEVTVETVIRAHDGGSTALRRYGMAAHRKIWRSGDPQMRITSAAAIAARKRHRAADHHDIGLNYLHHTALADDRGVPGRRRPTR